ncbi:anti-sigma factor [Herminiimonas sp. CN]|uniref:anti-sigma factor family protein n=1 Tax=Herminiimonas sp. CN TaxID=1349818 RepID=UPI0004739255|nr:zf-HC2 domain-containing protein [Herminiimonas sp. CN]
MHCPQHNKLSAYLDRALAAREYGQLTAHLQTCPLCRHQLEALAALQRNLRDLPSPVLGFDLAARLQDRIRSGAVQRRPVRSFWSAWGPAGLAATAALTGGVWLGVLLTGGTVASAPPAALVRVFDPVPPGGLCAAAELCRLSKGIQ